MTSEKSERIQFESSADLTVETVGAALSAIPYAGGPLAAIANGILSRRQNRRLSSFLLQLSSDMNELKEELNRKFLTSAEAEDLFESVVSRAADCRQSEKLDAFRSIFLHEVLSSTPGFDRAEEVLSLIDGFQARHIRLLRILSDPRRADSELGSPVGEGGGMTTSIQRILQQLLPDWSEDEIERTWEDLYAKKIHTTPGTKVMMTDRGIHQLEGRLSTFGTRVTNYLATLL